MNHAAVYMPKHESAIQLYAEMVAFLTHTLSSHYTLQIFTVISLHIHLECLIVAVQIFQAVYSGRRAIQVRIKVGHKVGGHFLLDEFSS